MKLWIAHKVSGEDYTELEKEMKEISEVISSLGHEPYCSFLQDNMRNEKDKKLLIENAFKHIDELDGTLAIIKSDSLSEGMLIEVGYNIAKNKKLILAIKKGIMENRYIRALADQTIEFSEISELKDKLGELK